MKAAEDRVSPIIICRSSNPQRDGIQRWGSGDIMRVETSYGDWCPSKSHEKDPLHHVKLQQEDTIYKPREGLSPEP